MHITAWNTQPSTVLLCTSHVILPLRMGSLILVPNCGHPPLLKEFSQALLCSSRFLMQSLHGAPRLL